MTTNFQYLGFYTFILPVILICQLQWFLLQIWVHVFATEPQDILAIIHCNFTEYLKNDFLFCILQLAKTFTGMVYESTHY